MAATTKRVAKRVRPKPPAKKTSDATKGPAKKKVAKKAPATKTAKPKSKAPAKKVVAKKTTTKRQGPVREVNEHGFVPGTDSAKIAEILLAGGTDRNDVNAQVAKAIGTKTRNGTEKNVPALVSGVLNRLLDNGYEVQATWVLVPGTKKAPAKRKRVAKKK